MDFNQVKFFLALANTLNFTRAAEQCHVSQPALTQAIRRLEEELGGKLIERNGRNNELSELGKAIREHFEQIDRTRHLIHSTAKVTISKEKIEFNLGIMCTIGPQLLKNMLNEFQELNPTISIIIHDVVPNSIEPLLLSGTLDGVICSCVGTTITSQLFYLDLYEEEMVVVFNDEHIFSGMNEVPLNVISKQNYIDRLHCEFRPQFLTYCDEEGIDLNVIFRSQREDWIQSLIHNGFGVCILPKYSILFPQLHYRPIVKPDMSRKIQLVYTGDTKKSPVLEMLIDLLSTYSWS